MEMPGRKYSAAGSYRYGFNGQMKSMEIGEDSYTAMYWEYDSRTGRRWNLDPKPTVGESDYSTNYGNPIKNSDPNGDATTGGGDPPVKLAATIGLRLSFGSSGASFNLTGSVGVQVGNSNTNLTGFVSGSVYGGSQLGTTPSGKGTQFDLSAGLYGSIGSGTGTARNFYTLNYNTPSPFKNTSDLSVSFGQIVTRNSAINAQGDGPGNQAQGIFGLRLGNNFALSYNNDSKSVPTFAGLIGKPLKIKGTDAGWTGGLTVNVGGVEAGYQNFSGYRLRDYPGFGVGRKYPQTSYQQSLNKASSFIQVGNVRAEYFGAAWLQNLIHNNISHESTYEYNYKNKVSLSGGITL